MNKKIFSLALLLVSMAAGVFFRFYPHLLPYYDILAAREVRDTEFSSIKKSVQKQYPQMLSSSQLKIADEVFKSRMKKGRSEIDAKIASRSRSLKDHFRDEEGHIYLNGIDSYYWFRLLNNLLTKGHIGDRQVNGVEYDDLVGNPIDSATKRNVHLWLGWTFYKIATLIHRDISLQEVLFFIPVFLSCLIAFFSFIVTRRLGANDLGAFFASVAVNLSPFLLSRSIGEWFDTDIYSVLFPLLVFGTFIFAFQERRYLRRILFMTLSGIFLACYASTWKGWWFILDIMLVSGLLFLANQYLSRQEEKTSPEVLKNQAFSLLFFFVSSAVFVIFLNGVLVWKDFITEPLRLSLILKVTAQNMWPNVYWTVAELGPLKPFEVANFLGGDFVFFGGMLGLVYISLLEHGFRNERYGFGLLCVVLWIVATFFSAVTAMRFVLLLVVPVGLAFGLTISKLYAIVDELSQKYFGKTRAVWVRTGCVLLFSTYLVSNTMTVHGQLLGTMPQMDDHWHRTLTEIKKDTPSDAIIDSWWDYGHWFKAVADRRVLFDGMTQNTPYAYWIAGALITEDETEAIGILRMINTSDNQTADLLEKRGGLDTAASVEMIKKALKKDPASARDYLLKEGVSASLTTEILSYLFPEKLPPVYLIISYDMLSKVGAIAYIGNWDFDKVDMWYKKKHLSKIDFLAFIMKKYGYTEEEAESKLIEISLLDDVEARQWFSQGWPPPSGISSAEQDGKILFFDNGLVVDLNSHHGRICSDDVQKRGVLQSLVLSVDGLLKEEPQKDPDLNLSALVMKDGDSYKSVLLNPAFAKSMLARLYYFKGEGLKYFKLFGKETEDNGGAIYVYKIEWPKKATNNEIK